jgi:hypothetical protein
VFVALVIPGAEGGDASAEPSGKRNKENPF